MSLRRLEELKAELEALRVKKGPNGTQAYPSSASVNPYSALNASTSSISSTMSAPVNNANGHGHYGVRKEFQAPREALYAHARENLNQSLNNSSR